MSASSTTWKFYRFGLLVTGKGEEQFLPRLFRSLVARGNCRFEVIRRIEQLTPRTSLKHRHPTVGSTQPLSHRDEEFALSALRHLSTGCDFVLLIDDLEGDRRDQADAVFRRYRAAFDAVLPAPLRCRASGHFLVNILEAYYLADASALNAVLKTDWSDHVGDVEEIRHPKNDLKNRFPGFDVIEHGEQILDQLDVPLVLDNPDTCSALRTLFGWCWRALGLAPTDEYQLLKGRYSDLTRAQLEQLPPVEEA